MEEQHDTAALTARRDALRQQVSELRAQRQRDEATAAHADRLAREIAEQRRDRDADMSPELERNRDEIEHAMTDVEDLVIALGRLWTRVQVAGLGEDDPRMRAARRAFEEKAAHALNTFSSAVNDTEGADGGQG